RRGDNPHRSARSSSEKLGDFFDDRRPIAALTLGFGHWTLDFPEPVFPVDPFVIQTAVVAHPAGIDRIVLARLITQNASLARANDDIAARRAARANAPGFLQKPDPHFKTEI